MLYKEEDLNPYSIDEVFSLMENASYLSDKESKYYPEIVPIRENTRLDKYIVRLEDLIDYSNANGIIDGSIAIQNIAESNNISISDIAFAVDEVSVLEDAHIEDTVRNILGAGGDVYVAPISENDFCYVLSESIIDLMLEEDQYGNTEFSDAIFEAFIEDDLEDIFNEGTFAKNIYNKLTNRNGFSDQQIQQDSQSLRQKMGNAITQAYSNSKNWTARKISSLKDLAGRLRNRPVKEEFGIDADNVLYKIDQGIDYLLNTKM